jgi:hypothetical protein
MMMLAGNLRARAEVTFASVAQLEGHQNSTLDVVGSSPTACSIFADVRGIVGDTQGTGQLCGGVERRSAIATVGNFLRHGGRSNSTRTYHAAYTVNAVHQTRLPAYRAPFAGGSRGEMNHKIARAARNPSITLSDTTQTLPVHEGIPLGAYVGRRVKGPSHFPMVTPFLSSGEQFKLNCKAALRALLHGNFRKVRFFLRGIGRALKS